MTVSNPNFEKDIQNIGSISVVSRVLEAICLTTGMGFAAVARVTPERWIACEVRDEIKFGLLPGGELQVDTTICHEIRQSGQPVIIDHVAEDEFYYRHHTPAMYGLQSYFSIPVVKQDGSFFGTLCAIDPSPALVSSPEIRGLFKVYAELISILLNAVENELADRLKKMQELSLQELDGQVAQMAAYHRSGDIDNRHRTPSFVKAIEGVIASTSQLINRLTEVPV
jgi:FOG: GAF domain